MQRPVAGLDRIDCRILRRLNSGKEMPRPVLKNRIEKLKESGLVEERNFGEVAITLRGQLELARWRYRNIPKPRFVFSGPMPRGSFFDRVFRSS